MRLAERNLDAILAKCSALWCIGGKVNSADLFFRQAILAGFLVKILSCSPVWHSSFVDVVGVQYLLLCVFERNMNAGNC